ncbi:MAG: FAD-dependent 5-carboxymethylaminomethyl-2-thiouridine(34) oxidoreductase MnmC [Marinagarivorans sp.]|nr:FAD-dependent 5-carboxymethylaminomethyl-2-thiouridine(34) oxidoreductase MnmC [Marinagarivorans sp.]
MDSLFTVANSTSSAALAHSRRVFLEGSQLPVRFAALAPYAVFTLGEIGFGCGLNFLSTWQLWQKSAHKDARLHFISLEKTPLTPAKIAHALALFPELALLRESLLALYPFPADNPVNRLYFDKGRVQLTLIFGDVADGLNEWLPSLQCGQKVQALQAHYGPEFRYCDAWFLPETGQSATAMTPALFAILAKLSHQHTTFTPAKNAITLAPEHPQNSDYTSFPRHYNFSESWHLLPSQASKLSESTPEQVSNTRPSVAVMGAGLAGCHSARALAERGYKVTVYEGAEHIAAGASGNPQGVVYTRFSHEKNALAQFNVAALRFADGLYQQGYYGTSGEHTGVFQQEEDAQARADAQRTTAHEVALKYHENPRFAHAISTTQAKTRVCDKVVHPGLFTHFGGWMRPDALCAQLLDHPNIRLQLAHRLNALEHIPSPLNPSTARWQMTFDEQPNATADIVIIATAGAAIALPQLAHLPTKNIRGQMSYLQLPAHSAPNLQAPACGEGYVGPAFSDKQHQTRDQTPQVTLCFGATFDVKQHSLDVIEIDNHKNTQMLKSLLPGFNLPASAQLKGRASLRCSTPDYLPLIGPVPNIAPFMETFSDYRKSKNWRIDALGQYHPNLYMSVGHGSRGLTYTPLAAELLACLINGEPIPIAESLYKHCHPARFTLRNLIRNKW